MSSANSRSPCMKRLMNELLDLQRDPSTEFIARPLDMDNLLEWHFTIRGPTEAGFAGGRYHGRLLFPVDYPFKPPNISFLTPNGRFEVGKKICLSITGHHPEYWRPAWGIRSALVALISFMPTKGEGAIGALDYTEEERKAIALKSKSYVCPTCGSRNADVLPDESVEPVQKLAVDQELLNSVRFQGEAAPTPVSASPATTGSPATASPAVPASDTNKSVKTTESTSATLDHPTTDLMTTTINTAITTTTAASTATTLDPTTPSTSTASSCQPDKPALAVATPSIPPETPTLVPTQAETLISPLHLPSPSQPEPIPSQVNEHETQLRHRSHIASPSTVPEPTPTVPQRASSEQTRRFIDILLIILFSALGYLISKKYF